MVNILLGIPYTDCMYRCTVWNPVGEGWVGVLLCGGSFLVGVLVQVALRCVIVYGAWQ